MLSGNPDCSWRVLAQIRANNPSLTDVTEINASGREDLGDGVLPAMCRLPLKKLNLAGTKVSNAGLSALTALADSLEELDLSRTEVNDDGLTPDFLAQFGCLTRLVVPEGVSEERIGEFAREGLTITREG